jgi:hypothetical protein
MGEGGEAFTPAPLPTPEAPAQASPQETPEIGWSQSIKEGATNLLGRLRNIGKAPEQIQQEKLQQLQSELTEKRVEEVRTRIREIDEQREQKKQAQQEELNRRAEEMRERLRHEDEQRSREKQLKEAADFQRAQEMLAKLKLEDETRRQSQIDKVREELKQYERK